MFDRAVAAEEETRRAAHLLGVLFFFSLLFCSLSLHSRLTLSLCSCSYLCGHLPAGVMRSDIPRVQECLNEAASVIARLDNERQSSSVLAEAALK